MAQLYAKKIIEGKRDFDSVPDELKDEVYQLLVEDGYFLE